MQNPKSFHLLIVDDEPDVAKMLSLLVQTNFDALVDTAESCASAREKLASNTYDLITLDQQLADGTGLRLLLEISTIEGHPPVIMVTGQGDEQTAVSAFKLGADGYVVKDRRLSALLVQEINSSLAKVALKHAEDELRAGRERYRQIFENISSGVAVYEVAGDAQDFIIKEFNSAAERIDKIDRESVIGHPMTEVFPGVKAFGLFEVFQKVARTGKPERHLLSFYEDETRSGYRENYVYRLPSGEIVAIYDDMSELVETEDALKKQEKMLFEKSLDAVLWADVESGVILDCNRAAEELLETSRSQLIGRHQSELHPPEKAEVYKEVFKRHVERKEVIEEEAEVITASGEIKTVLISTLIIQREGRGIIQGAFHDVTRRRQLEDELKETNARLESLLRSTRAVLYTTDITENYPATYITQNVKELYGYDQSDFIDEKDFWLSHVHPDDVGIIEPAIQTLLERGSNTYDYRFLHQDGKYRWVRDDMRLVYDERGEPSEIVGFFTDITDRKEAEEELVRSNLDLDSYAQGVSHDIKGPLSSALVSCDLLRDKLEKVTDPESRSAMLEFLELVCHPIDRSLAMAEDLLTFSLAGRAAPRVSLVDVGELVREILEENAKDMDGMGITVKVAADLGRVRANRVHMYQLFGNLLRNAIKYNDSPEPVIEVASLGEDETGGHRYLVRDNGPGLPAGDIDRVFEPFFAGDEGATGVGLSLVKKVIDLCSGEIKAYNDCGACFEFVVKDLA